MKRKFEIISIAEKIPKIETYNLLDEKSTIICVRL